MFLLLGCQTEESSSELKTYNKIKYGTVFTVQDDFYGSGLCVATEKWSVGSAFGGLGTLAVIGECKFNRSTKNIFMRYKVKDITIIKE